MQAERSLVRKILYVLKGLGESREVKMSGIDVIYDDEGKLIGYKIELIKEQPRLRIISTGQEND